MTTSIGAVEVVSDGEEVARIAAAAIVETARRRPPVGLFLAAGSTARRAYEVVAASATADDLADVDLWMVDDRTVRIDHPESNAGMIAAALGGAAARARLHAMPCPDGPDGVDAERAAIDAALRARGGDAPRPDLTILGVGGDGHVGGLVPGDPGLGATGLFTVVKRGARITATRGLLAASRQLIFLLSGASKAAIAAQIQADPRLFPAGVVALEARAAGGDVTWLLDRAAAPG